MSHPGRRQRLPAPGLANAAWRPGPGSRSGTPRSTGRPPSTRDRPTRGGRGPSRSSACRPAHRWRPRCGAGATCPRAPGCARRRSPTSTSNAAGRRPPSDATRQQALADDALRSTAASIGLHLVAPVPPGVRRSTRRSMRLARVVRVQRREDEVARLGRRSADASWTRVEVAHRHRGEPRRGPRAPALPLRPAENRRDVRADLALVHRRPLVRGACTPPDPRSCRMCTRPWSR